MKKFTLIAGAALMALGASAQNFNGDVLCVKDYSAKYGKGTYYVVAMDEYSQEQLTKAGNTVVWIGPDSDDQILGQNLWYWDGFAAGQATLPAPGWDNDENMSFSYTSLDVTGKAGWSGAGFNIRTSNDETGATFPLIDMKFNENSRFFMCYATNSTAPASVGYTILHQDGKDGEDAPSSPAHFGVGTAYNDNGEIWPSFGATASNDWQSIDVSFADMAKSYSTFKYPTTPFAGNTVAFLAGNVAGTNISMDNIFFFTPEGENAIEGVEADNANAPVEYYNLQGVKVANPENGLYIKVQGNKATKVVL